MNCAPTFFILPDNYISELITFKIKNEFMETFQQIINGEKPVLVDFYAKLFHCDKKKFHVVYDSMSLSPKEEQRTIEHRIIGVTTYSANGETKVYGADAPEELKGNTVLTIASIDNVI